jgi:hypothetical protein
VTLDDYAKQVAEKMRQAHNNKNLTAVGPLFSDADRTLTDSNIGANDRAEFWTNVRRYFLSSGLLVERQANSALLALMQAIQNGIAARTTKQ